MSRSVRCSIRDMPDGRFGVVATLATGRTFERKGLLTLAEADACVEELRTIMAACGAPVFRETPTTPRDPTGQRYGASPLLGNFDGLGMRAPPSKD